MQTVGIDMSAEPRTTAIAVLSWYDDYASVATIQSGKSADDLVLHYLHHPDGSVGVDCPLGWPASFVDFVSAHAAAELHVPSGRPGGDAST